jgi:CRISPR-associated protein Cas1
VKKLLNTLYVTTPEAYLRLESDTLCVMIEHEKRLQVPLHHLSAIVCFGEVMLSPALLARCAEDGRSVVWMKRNGRFGARLEGPVNGNILLRQAQHRAADDVQFCVGQARAFIAGKLQNSRQVLLRSAREQEDEIEAKALIKSAERIGRHIEKLPDCQDAGAILGQEGDAARIYFGDFEKLLRKRVRKDFAFNGRNRRPPLDPINALLSFLYTLLLNDCRSALEGVGLDPQLGFLHTVRPGRMSLALDLMEEFRPAIADRLVLTLINRGQIKAKNFSKKPGGAVLLEDKARRLVITSYQERKKDEVQHPLLEEKTPIGLLPHLQARLLARVLRGDLEHYIPYSHK